MHIKGLPSVSIVLFILLLTGCGKFAYYKVKPGDTLYSIGWQYGADYRQLAAWNDIQAPYILKPGQWLRVVPQDPYYKDPNIADERVVQNSKPVFRPPVVVKPETKRRSSLQFDRTQGWQWPVIGPLLYTYSSKDTRKQGIGVQGRLGQPVRAAADGQVVYSGTGLVGYGHLVIIKHNDAFLSAYGHNARVLVKEGQFVRRGQQIATLGRSGARQPLLHFEIRKNGKAVNPLAYLPKL
ncbi:MAG: LysM peptidoglycan-binding domain-containing protein [Gammaproteobacteria bacterium]|nr:MAG: LysM peptidoglycan-binding domain-containing protein [Gammaproteobacteria bacterium]